METTIEERKPMTVHCSACEHEWAPIYLPAPAAIVAKVMKANRLCPRCFGKEIRMGAFPRATAEGDPIAWLTNGDTGMSSMTIWSVMMGRKSNDPSVPWDPSDFGRCYRLLRVMPSWRQRLPEVAAKHPAWTGLVKAWDELTALYEEELPRGTAPKLYARIKHLTRATA